MSKKIEVTSRGDEFHAFIEQTKKVEYKLKKELERIKNANGIEELSELTENEKLSLLDLRTFRVFDDFELTVKLRDVFNEMEDEGWRMFKDDGYVNLTSNQMKFVKDFMMCILNQSKINPNKDAK